MKDNVRRPKPNLHWPRTRSARHCRSFREPYFLNVARARINSFVIDDVYHNTESPTSVKPLLQKARFSAKWIASRLLTHNMSSIDAKRGDHVLQADLRTYPPIGQTSRDPFRCAIAIQLRSRSGSQGMIEEAGISPSAAGVQLFSGISVLS